MSVKSFAGFFKEYWPVITVLWGLLVFSTTVISVGLWTLFGEPVVSWLRDELGIEELSRQVARVTGEDRVIRQPHGLSYVREPVKVGEDVAIILTAERTALGASCRLLSWVPIFTDERNIPTPRDQNRTLSSLKQMTTDLVTLRVEVTPPELRPGRVTVYLALDYKCGDMVVPDRTHSLAYTLLPE